MNKPEVGKLLLLASGFDRRIVDDLTVSAWFSVPAIQQASFDDAAAAVITHQTDGGGEYLQVRHVVAYVTGSNRQDRESIAADVRSARARGLVSKDWNERDPIPDDVRARLMALREESRRLAPDLHELEASGHVDVGEVGRRL